METCEDNGEHEKAAQKAAVLPNSALVAKPDTVVVSAAEGYSLSRRRVDFFYNTPAPLLPGSALAAQNEWWIPVRNASWVELDDGRFE
jgi:hypothetical protein